MLGGSSTYSTYIGWIIDSGASQHITFSSEFLFDIMDVTDLNLTVSHPNRTAKQVKQIGSYKMGNNLVIKDVLVVPGYHVSLLSVHKLSRDYKVIVSFNDSKCKIQDLTQKFLMGIDSENGCLYFHNEGKRAYNSNIKWCQVSSCIWHNRLGHPSDEVLTVLKDKIKDLNQSKSGPCEIYHKAKQNKEPFPISDHKTSNLGDLVHLDVWGRYRVKSWEGFMYFLNVVDDYTRALWVFLMQNKAEVFDNITEFYTFKNQFNTNVKIFKSDNGTEFVNKNDRSLRSSEPNDDGGDSEVNVNTVDDVTKDHRVETMSMYFGQLFETPKTEVGQPVRRSSRKSSMPSKYKDYVLNKNAKYSIDKVVNYSHLGIENFVYTISLNKIHEPSTFVEVVKDSRWVEAMNQEIEALNINKTWIINDLPEGRKPIWSKWLPKVLTERMDRL
ncbi:putative RNA-directed DNA polymerase [Tanacetum coccineum]